MTLKKITSKVDLMSLKEIDKVLFVSFYYQQKDPEFCFSIDDICTWFSVLDLHLPNKYRLKQNLKKSHSFIKGKNKDSYRIHANEIKKLNIKYSFMSEKNEDVESLDTILPSTLYLKSRGYIESLCKQINASYENNIFDGCAVLMRRLLEICLIHSYEHIKIENTIKDSQGNFKMLSDIVSDAKVNTKLGLSRNTKSCIEEFRILGNFSAHKIYYNAKKAYIEKVILDYRATIEELLYKSGLKK